MPTPTYNLLEEIVLGSAQASVTLGSGGTIPQTYKDLVIEFVGYASVATDNVGLRFNNDSTTVYSYTYVAGNGTTPSSNRGTGLTSAIVANYTPQSGSPGFDIINVMSYASTSVYKTAISRNNDAGNWVAAYVALWRKTDAITSIVVICPGGNVNSGTTVRLWGVGTA